MRTTVPTYTEALRALAFCRDRLESWQRLMSECDGLAGWNKNGEVASWGQVDEPVMTNAALEVADRVLAGGCFYSDEQPPPPTTHAIQYASSLHDRIHDQALLYAVGGVEVGWDPDIAIAELALSLEDYAAQHLQAVARALRKWSPELAERVVDEWRVASGQQLLEALKAESLEAAKRAREQAPAEGEDASL